MQIRRELEGAGRSCEVQMECLGPKGLGQVSERKEHGQKVSCCDAIAKRPERESENGCLVLELTW